MPRSDHGRDASGVGDDLVRRLAINDFYYRQLLREVSRLHRRDDPELLSFIETVARYAWWSHPGRLADGALDNILLEIGREMADPPSSAHPGSADTAPRTLHVATELYVTGGHSRVLAKWVERDLSSSHTIVVTRQNGELPPYLLSIAAERAATVTVLDRGEPIYDRARKLRALSRDADRVILHHHPDDAVPVLAYAPRGGPTVAMFNHAHFWFSLGSGVADTTINTMPYFRRLTEGHRFPRRTDLLEGPLGLDRLTWTEINKADAKRHLGLSPDRPVAMTIGAEPYFTPSRDVDFFATLAKLLATRPDLQVLVVGVRAESALVPQAIRDDGRVMLAGPVADPRSYYQAADICLESFPMPSLGALVESVTYGQAFPVPAFADAENPLRVNQQRIATIAVRQRTEADYIRYVGELLDAPEATAKQVLRLRQTLIDDDTRFGDQFAALYDRMAELEHLPRELPQTAMTVTPETLALASLTTPARAREAIYALPIRAMIIAHWNAVAQGYDGAPRAALAVARRMAGAVARPLRNAWRRRR